jgi:hypothetical protein
MEGLRLKTLVKPVKAVASACSNCIYGNSKISNPQVLEPVNKDCSRYAEDQGKEPTTLMEAARCEFTLAVGRTKNKVRTPFSG